MSLALSFSLTAAVLRRRRTAPATTAVPMLSFGITSNSQYIALGF